MRLEKASYKAIKYACMNFHYAKRIPTGTNIGYSVFNDEDIFCGVILYGNPATPAIANSLNLRHGELLELRRVALNSKHGITSKAVSISIKLLKKDCPTIKLVVSYADKGQNHLGVIYQATNWLYLGESESSGIEHFCNGKWLHSRHGRSNVTRKLPGKYKYVYPLNNLTKKNILLKSKPYPKKETNAAIAQGSAPGFQSGDGVRSDLAAQLKTAIKQP
jgi:hypothetical protein